MPFTIKYDPDNGGVAIMGLVSAEEADDFENVWIRARNEMFEARKTATASPAKKKERGNWFPLFIAAVRQATQHTPDPRMSDKPGFKALAIKLWRGVAAAGYHEARDYVECLMRRSQSDPEGYEFGDISSEALSEASKEYQLACQLLESM